METQSRNQHPRLRPPSPLPAVAAEVGDPGKRQPKRKPRRKSQLRKRKLPRKNRPRSQPGRRPRKLPRRRPGRLPKNRRRKKAADAVRNCFYALAPPPRLNLARVQWTRFFFTWCKKRYTNILLPSHNLNLGRVGVFWRMRGANSFAKLAVIVAS